MNNTWSTLAALIPKIDTRPKLAAAFLLILAMLMVSVEIGRFYILLLAIVPLLLIIVLSESMRKSDLRAVVIVYALSSASFIGAGCFLFVLETHAATAATARDYLRDRDGTERQLASLNAESLIEISPMLRVDTQYPEYRALFLHEWKKGNALEKERQLRQILAFYTKVLDSEAAGGVPSEWVAQSFDQNIKDIWYTFRPAIEDMRQDLDGPSYASSVQQRAEMVLPPRWRSEVVRDPQTGGTQLRFQQPLRE